MEGFELLISVVIGLQDLHLAISIPIRGVFGWLAGEAICYRHATASGNSPTIFQKLIQAANFILSLQLNTTIADSCKCYGKPLVEPKVMRLKYSMINNEFAGVSPEFEFAEFAGVSPGPFSMINNEFAGVSPGPLSTGVSPGPLMGVSPGPLNLSLLKLSGLWLALMTCGLGTETVLAQSNSLNTPPARNSVTTAEGRVPLVSSGSGATGVKAQVPSHPTERLLLNRHASKLSTETSTLDLGESQKEPDSNLGPRPISLNTLQKSLPAAAQPRGDTDYSTASPYKLRALEKESKLDSRQSPQSLRATPVSSATSQSLRVTAYSSEGFSAEESPSLRAESVSSAKNAESGAISERLVQNAPRVSRIPLPNSNKADLSSQQPSSSQQPIQAGPFTGNEKTPLNDSNNASRASELRKQPSNAPGGTSEPPALDDSPAPTAPELPKLPALPALPELPALSQAPQSVNVPTLLPRSSAADLGLQSSDTLPKNVREGDDSSPGLPALTTPPIALPNLTSSNLNAGSSSSLEGNRQPRSSSPAKSSTSPIDSPQKVAVPSTQSTPNSRSELSKIQSSSQNDIERLRLQTPRIQVTLNGPKELAINAPQVYQLVVRNDDRINLGGIILRLDIPPGVAAQAQPTSHGRADVERAADGTTMLTWAFENLEGGAEAKLPIQVIAETPKNFAVAMEWTLSPIAGRAGIDVLTPQLELALEGPNDVNFSEPNVYRLHIRNRGNADANEVTVKLAAEHYGSSSTQIGRIAAGEQQTVDVELVFNEPGNITIAAEVAAAGNVTAASQVGIRVRQSLLEASLEAPEMAYHSTKVPCVLTIKNTGDAIAKNSKAVVVLPVDCIPSSLPPQATFQNGNIVWDMSQLRPGQSSEMPFDLTFSREGDNRITVQCTANSATPVQCSSTTQVKAVTDLKLFVTDPVAPAPVNGEVEYELTLVNRGSKAAEQVTVVAMFSKDIEPMRAEGHRSQIATGQVRFQPISRIEPGQTISLKVFAQAASAGMHRFRAEVRTSEAEVKLVQEQSTEFMESIRRTANSTGGELR